MALRTADFLIIGGGIAGASVAYELSAHGTVILLEMESSVGYHSTGRSAAVLSENYGSTLWRLLVTGSRSFLANPPAGFSDVPLVTPRGALFLALENEQDKLNRQADELRRRGAAIELMTARQARRYCPVIKASAFTLALYEPNCQDIDTHALLTGYLRAFRARGGRVFTNAQVERLSCLSERWLAETKIGNFEAATVVNAAGAWVQQVARMAGIEHRNVVPFRRTAVTFDPPAGSEIGAWPMTFDVSETFYFRPEAGRIMVSPVDMALTAPCDAQADELEVAIAIDRIHTLTDMTVRSVKSKWGGLRTFAPDHEPVIGPDPDASRFIWLAGHGGNGVMGAAAAARMAASLAIGASVPDDLVALGLTAEKVSPWRQCVCDPHAALSCDRRPI
jgi:D-arginine dehydrogenase